MTEKKVQALIAKAVAEALASANSGKARKQKDAPVRGSVWKSEREVVRNGYRFVFTLVQAGIRNGAYDKYSCAITRMSDGASIEARPKVAAGMSIRERYTSGALDALVGFRSKKFAPVA